MLRKEHFFALVAVLLGLTGGIVAGEVVVRILAPEWLEYRMTFLRSGRGTIDEGSDLLWPFDAVEGRFVRFKPNHQFRVATAEYQNTVHIDSLGGRTTCRGKGDAAAQSVAILGDSFTLGIGVEDCEVFASLLASEYRAFRILNLGVSGSALPQQLFIASQRQSDIGGARIFLFFFFLGNDFSDMIAAQPYWWELPEGSGAKPDVPASRPSASRRLLEQLNYLSHLQPFSNSYLLQFVRAVALQAYLGARAGPVEMIFKAMFVKDTDHLDAMRTALRRNLDYLQVFVRKTNSTAMLVAIPDRYQLLEANRERQARYYGIAFEDLNRFLPNQILAQEASTAGVQLLDPSDCLDKRSDKASFYYTNDNHFTKAGHQAFFDCIRGPVGAFLGNAR